MTADHLPLDIRAWFSLAEQHARAKLGAPRRQPWVSSASLEQSVAVWELAGGGNACRCAAGQSPRSASLAHNVQVGLQASTDT